MLRRKPLPILLVLVGLIWTAASASARSEPLRPYKHPASDLQFTAEKGWRVQPRPGDEDTCELVDPAGEIHVLLWSTTTEQSAERYLRKMSHMMDLGPGTEPLPRELDRRPAWVLAADGRVDGQEARSLFAVIPSGRSAVHPFETVLHLVQIWCPTAAAARLADRMDDLLTSVRIADTMWHDGRAYPLYPETNSSPVDLPSPCMADDGRVYLTVQAKDGRYGLVEVTVENGAPNNYSHGEWDKGDQLTVDSKDFPALAATGLHDEAELAATQTITGRPVADITQDGRPGAASAAGFLAADEDLIPVLRGDNRLVAALGLTHPQVAAPLFQVYNLVLRDLALYQRGAAPVYNLALVLYSKRELALQASAAKGWQESIFDDEVHGYWQIELYRPLTTLERDFLRGRYAHLGEAKYAELVERLTRLHTGEMAPFYIMRYGFYEGHTSYRADPVVVTFLFGLRSIEEIEATFEGRLYDVLTRHHLD